MHLNLVGLRRWFDCAHHGGTPANGHPTILFTVESYMKSPSGDLGAERKSRRDAAIWDLSLHSSAKNIVPLRGEAFTNSKSR